MRVGIDLRPLRPAVSGGLVQFTEGLCHALFTRAPDVQFFSYRSPASYRLPGVLPGNVVDVPLADDSETVALDVALARDRVDVLFRPFPVDDELVFPQRRRFVLAPDFQHEDCPDYFSPEQRLSRSRAFRRAIEQGGAVGLLSNHACERLRAHFPEARAQVVFVPPGPPSAMASMATPLSEGERHLIPDGPFFLYPANLWPHKNHDRLIQAFQRFLDGRSGNWSLVLTGDDLMNLEGLLAEFPTLPVRHLGFVSARLLTELYRRCAALTYISLYEGFGIPLLEAFKLGAPVICSNSTSLPEVGGDAALQCDPTDVAEIAALMARAADSPELCEELRRRGQAQLARYEWDRSARFALHAFRTLALEPLEHADVLDAIQMLGGQLAAAQAVRDERGRVIEALQGPRFGRAVVGAQIACEPVASAVAESSLDRAIQRVQFEAAESEGPLVSVIIPMVDHRGQAVRSVRSWAQGQSLPRDSYEVIVLSDGASPALEASVRTLLSPQDRLIVGPAGNEVRLYDLGARAAHGQWLFFTEAHCFGERRTLELIMRYLEETGLDGACCQSRGVATNLLAQMEERVFEQVSPNRLAPGHWSKLFMRGSALSRELYLKVGGLAWRYGLFAEPELAARLHALGYRVGYASEAVVRHFNTHSVAELRSAIQDYVCGEALYRQEHPDGAGNAFFGAPDWWTQRSLLDAEVSRSTWRSLGQALKRPSPERRALASLWVTLLPSAMLGARAQVLRADWAAWQARARCWWWRNRRDRLAAPYADLWPALARQAGVRALAEAQRGPESTAYKPGTSFHMTDLPDDWHTGFHAIEEFGGRQFRWSGPVACLKLPLERREQTLRLDTLGLRHEPALSAYLNGRKLTECDDEAVPGEILLSVRTRDFRPGPLQYLVLVSEPLRPWLEGVPDSRELGLPISRIVCV